MSSDSCGILIVPNMNSGWAFLTSGQLPLQMVDRKLHVLTFDNVNSVHEVQLLTFAKTQDSSLFFTAKKSAAAVACRDAHTDEPSRCAEFHHLRSDVGRSSWNEVAVWS